MKLDRRKVETALDAPVDLLDDFDGDADFEPELGDEQHDVEADLTWESDTARMFFVMAQRAKKKGQV